MNLWEKIRTPLPLGDLAEELSRRQKEGRLVKTESLAAVLKSKKRTGGVGAGTTPRPISHVIDLFLNKATGIGECMIVNPPKGRERASVFVAGKEVSASRFAYVIFKSRIPDGMQVLHKCDNPACINPDHLFLGTHDDNMHDRKTKGRYSTVPKGESKHNSKLTEDDVKEIRAAHASGKESYTKLAKRFNVSFQLIGNIVTKKVWRHIV